MTMKQKIELIKSKITLSSLVATKILLKNKKGLDYIGLCPFHKEKTPSFFVNDEKRVYHCFGCGVHGDIFSFIMQIEGITYEQSLKKLSSMACVAININSKNEIDIFENNNIFFQIYQKLTKLYQKLLFSKIGKNALNYILSRGIKLEIIKKYDLGFSPKNSSIILKEMRKEFSENDLLKSKIINKKNNLIYDPFYGRLIFPIKNKNKKYVGFGGRSIDDKKPKYLNSAENPIFIKSDCLYGYDYTNNRINKSHDVLVVEGYMDVITLANYGITNSVAVLGAGVKISQIQTLWSVWEEPIICFDNDLAGQNAEKKIAYESLKYISHKKSLKFTKLVGGKDPDEVIKKKGEEFFKALVLKSISLSDYIFNIELQTNVPETPEKKIALKINLEKTVTMIQNSFIRKSYLQHFINKYYKFTNSSKGLICFKNEKAKYSQFFIIEKKDQLCQETLFVLNVIWNYPNLLDNSKIREELINNSFVDDIDNIRQILLNFYFYSNNHLSIYRFSNIKNVLKKIDLNQLIRQLIKFKEHGTEKYAKKKIFTALNMKKIKDIQNKIILLKKQLLIKADFKLIKKMLYLKKIQKKLSINL